MTINECKRFDTLLDLYAADECDPASAAAVRAHLEDCGRCRETVERARQMLGLLDLHFGEKPALTRLGDELRRQARPVRSGATHQRVVRRLTALAAMMLVCLGLGLWLEPGRSALPALPIRLEASGVLSLHGNGIEMVPAFPAKDVPHRAKKAQVDTPLPVVVNLGGRSLRQWRQDIAAGLATGKLPLPPQAEIRLTLTNPGARPLHVRTGGESFVCRLELQGGVVRRLFARGDRSFAPIEPATETIPPGQQITLRWDRLVEVDGDRAYYLYPLTAGDYTLTVRLRSAAWRDGEPPRTLWLTAASGVKVKAEDRK